MSALLHAATFSFGFLCDFCDQEEVLLALRLLGPERDRRTKMGDAG